MDYGKINLAEYRTKAGLLCKQIRRKMQVVNGKSTEVSLIIYETNEQSYVPTEDLTILPLARNLDLPKSAY